MTVILQQSDQKENRDYLPDNYLKRSAGTICIFFRDSVPFDQEKNEYDGESDKNAEDVHQPESDKENKRDKEDKKPEHTEKNHPAARPVRSEKALYAPGESPYIHQSEYSSYNYAEWEQLPSEQCGGRRHEGKNK
jgi:hypothetical protein